MSLAELIWFSLIFYLSINTITMSLAELDHSVFPYLLHLRISMSLAELARVFPYLLHLRISMSLVELDRFSPTVPLTIVHEHELSRVGLFVFTYLLRLRINMILAELDRFFNLPFTIALKHEF